MGLVVVVPVVVLAGTDCGGCVGGGGCGVVTVRIALVVSIDASSHSCSDRCLVSLMFR